MQSVAALGVAALAGWLAGCGDGAESAGGAGGALGPPTVGGLVIEEFFYAGSPGLVEHTFRDQFVDLRNDSNGLVHADGLFVGDAFGAAGEINPGQPTSPFAGDDDHVYLANVFRVPGGGADVPLLPGETLTLVQDGTNHQPDSLLDLSGADFEAFIESSGNDDDWPTVPNLEVVHFTGGFDWLVPVFGGTMVVFRLNDDSELELVEHPAAFGPVARIPVAAVLDCVEALMDADSGAYKRVPSAVDAGFTHVSDTYTGESVRRRARADGAVPRLVDDHDSSTDFELAPAPLPGE